MFFNGDYRRKPEQNFSGNSRNQVDNFRFSTNFVLDLNLRTCFPRNQDRQALIRNAQIERQKREEFRRQVQSSIIIQSQIRSYLERQKKKEVLKESFDSFARQCSGTLDEGQLEFLLVRLLFFYNRSDVADCSRLIALCQIIVRNPQLVFNQLGNFAWKHRLNRTILLCIKQLFNTGVSQVG